MTSLPPDHGDTPDSESDEHRLSDVPPSDSAPERSESAVNRSATQDADEVDDLVEEESPSPQLWSEDVELPGSATPVSSEPVDLPPNATPEEKQPFVRRTKARELALQMLFQADVNPDTSEQDVADQLRERLPQADLFQFAWNLYQGVLRDQNELDAAISATSTNWRLARMAVTDRNILRLGAYELKAVDTPYGVVLDEAIDMAKKFGTNQSASFVNGVLDKLVPVEKRPATASGDAAADGTLLNQSEPQSEAAETKQPTEDDNIIPARARPEEVAALSTKKPIAFKRRRADEQDGAEPNADEGDDK